LVAAAAAGAAGAAGAAVGADADEEGGDNDARMAADGTNGAADALSLGCGCGDDMLGDEKRNWVVAQ